MAGSAVIGALRVVLGADTAAFESGLKGAQSKMDSFGSGMAKAGVAIGVAMAAAATALAVSIKHAVDEADKLGKMAQKIGVPVEELSALKHAADLSGVGIEALGTSMGKLAKTMVEAAAKPASEAANAFRALGVSVTNSDGTLKSSSQVLSDVAGKFEGLKDGAGKTAVSMAIFGKSGKDMIPLLNSGAQGLQEMKDEAAKLGIVIDNQTAKSAEAFNDNLTRLGKAKDGIILKITAGMLPAMEDLSAAMVQTAKDTDGLKSIGEILGGSLKVLATIGNGVADVFKQLSLNFNAVVAAISLAAKGEFSAALGVFRAWQEESNKLSVAGQAAFDALWGGGADGATRFANAVPPATKVQKDFNFAALGGKDAIDKFVESTNKSLAAQTAEMQTTGMAVGAKERLQVTMQAYQVAAAANIPITDALRLTIYNLGITAEQTALKLAGQQLVFANKDPLVQYQTEMANTEIAMRAVGATAEEIARAQEKVGERFGNTWSAIGTNIAGTAGALSQLAGTFAKENKAMGIASKAFGIGQAIINTQIAITKALATLPPPVSYFAVGLAVAQGAAAVASIAAQSFAKGGSFTVPGGSSMTDNMMVPLNLASGERVDITPANEVGRGGGAQTIVHVHPRSRLERDYLAEMIEGINGMVADGYRLKVA